MTKTGLGIGLLVTVLGLIGGSVYWKSLPDDYAALSSIATSTTPAAVETVSTVVPILETTGNNPADITVSAHPGMKLYRNDEFGFEFWYPEGWEWKEDLSRNPLSKLNVKVIKIDGLYTNQFESFNLVTPEFYENYLRNMQRLDAATSAYVIDNVTRVQYRYVMPGASIVDIAFPLGENFMLFGTEVRYADSMDRILSTFERLNQ